MIEKVNIEHVAHLARLSISEVEANEYGQQLEKALEHFKQISKIDTTGVEPLVSPLEIETFWREDILSKEFTAEEMTANAPSKAGNLFKVPPVI